MSVSHPNEGPSQALVAWRRFVIETMLCFELLAVIAFFGFELSGDVFAGAAIATLVAGILRIVWHRG